MTIAPSPPQPGLSISVTGHRQQHAAYPADDAMLKQTLSHLFTTIHRQVEDAPNFHDHDGFAPTRLHTLLADGVDQLSAHKAKELGWELSIPLPFGEKLAMAINALPASVSDVESILGGSLPKEKIAQDRLAPIADFLKDANCFELADQDEKLTALLLQNLRQPDDFQAAQEFALESGIRFALTARILVEQAHLLVAVWDGKSIANIGGTGHTVTVALQEGVPVLWINPGAPAEWKILHAPEALVEQGRRVPQEQIQDELRSIIERSLVPPIVADTQGAKSPPGLSALSTKQWRPTSNWTGHAYRRLEASLGGKKGATIWPSVRQTYELPTAIEKGTGKALLAAISDLPDGDPALASRIGAEIMRRFAWADGISTRLSDSYRGGMTINFLLGSMAIISGIAYLPLVDVTQKWIFALAEFLMLLGIIGITMNGQRKQLHQRWFETRRVAEYLRHSPLLIAMGVSRPAGNWPQGTDTSWPEWYARQSLRFIGLPHGKVTRDTLRSGLLALRDVHLRPQCNYHLGKAKRLNRVHHRLEHISDNLFKLAVLVVGTYLVIAALQASGLFVGPAFDKFAKICTVLAVALPTLGGAIAGLRFFGDFERFASISEVTAEKLDALDDRITLLLDCAGERLDYRAVSDLLHAADAVVISEIENWQSVFSAKRISVPV